MIKADAIKEASSKTKLILSLLAVFFFGALTSNAIWMFYSNIIAERYVKQIQSIEASYKYQLGQQRTKIEKKIDAVLEKLNTLPSTPIVIDARSKLEEVKKGDD